MKSGRLKFFVGLNTGYVTDGEPDQRYIDFYASRSSASLHCIIIGNVVIPGGYGSNGNTPTISNSKIWNSVARSISAGGCLAGIQLATAWENYQGSRTFRPRDAKEVIGRSRELVRSLGTREISKILASVEEGSLMAIEAGFRHVQLHAAHGYLFSLLVDDRIYDGADHVLGRLVEWFGRIRAVGVETSIRISLRTGDREFDSAGTDKFQDIIANLHVDYVDVSSGFYNIDKQLIYPSRPDTIVERHQETISLANKYPRGKFILSGRAIIGDDLFYPDNIHIGLCRDLIANPNFADQNSDGCINSGKCHYFSRGEKHITCSKWG